MVLSYFIINKKHLLANNKPWKFFLRTARQLGGLELLKSEIIIQKEPPRWLLILKIINSFTASSLLSFCTVLKPCCSMPFPSQLQQVSL